MAFVSIGIKTSIPVTVPSATSGAVTFTSIDEENWLQIGRRFGGLGLFIFAALVSRPCRVACVHGRQAHVRQQRDIQRPVQWALPIPQPRRELRAL